MTEKQKQALTVGVVLAILLGIIVGYYYFMFVQPDIDSARKKRTAAEAAIQTKQGELDRINKFLANKAERESLAQLVEDAQKRLPRDAHDVDFLDILRDSLARTGVNQSRVAPKTPVKRANYYEIPYDIAGSARYHEFGQFLNVIECNSERFMRVSRFDLKNNAKRPSVHPMEVGISTFMFQSN